VAQGILLAQNTLTKRAKKGGFPFYIPLRTLMVAIRLRAKHTESAQMTLRTIYIVLN